MYQRKDYVWRLSLSRNEIGTSQKPRVIFLLHSDGFNDFVYVNADSPRQRQLGQGIDHKHDNAPNSKEENALGLHDGMAIVTDASRGSRRGTS